VARRLVVLRHSKAEPHSSSDASRKLADRGHRDAADAGRFLAEAGLAPDHVLVSAATRTQETWAEVHAQVGGDPLVDVTWDLYDAGPEDVVVALRSVPEDAATVLVVGHNPTMAQLVHTLDDETGDDEARQVLDEGFATSAVAVLDVDVAWSDLAPGAGRLTHGYVGRG
jgi:phosphohistidine phosphatase